MKILYFKKFLNLKDLPFFDNEQFLKFYDFRNWKIWEISGISYIGNSWKFENCKFL